MVRKKQETSQEIIIKPLKRGSVKLRIVGTTPLFQNRMAKKAKQTLLVGGGKKTAVEKKELKHQPLAEFRDSVEMIGEGPSLIGLQVPAIKGAMCTAAVETAGLTRAGTQRLLFMPGDLINLYGTPMLRMDVVRNADINKTPDVRTRAYFEQWGAEVEIQYIMPQLSVTSVVTLLCNAGVLIGVGDYRQEKGKGAFGSFRVLGEGEKDKEWDHLVKHHGKKAQKAALESPSYAGNDTTDLMEFFALEEQKRAEQEIVQTVRPSKSGNGLQPVA